MSAWQRLLLHVWLSQFFSLMGFGLGLPLAPYYIQDLGITDLEQVKWWSAWFYTAAWIPMAFMAPLWGMISDRHGRRPMLLRANLAGALVLFGTAMVPSVEWLIVMRVLQGAFTGTMTAAVALVAANTPEDKQGFALGSLSGAVFGGMMMGSLMGGLLAEKFGYRLPFHLGAIMLLIATGVSWVFVEENFVPPPPRPKDAIRLTWRQWVQALGPGTPILLLLLVVAIARQYDIALLPLLVQEINGGLTGSASSMGILSGVASVGAMVAAFSLGRLADKISPAAVARLSAIGAALFMFGHAFCDNMTLLFVLRLLVSFCAGGLDPVFQIWLSRATPKERRGIVFGLAVTARTVGGIIAPLASAMVASQWGVRSVFLYGPILYLLLLPIIFYVAYQVAAFQAANPELNRPTPTVSPVPEKLH